MAYSKKNNNEALIKLKKQIKDGKLSPLYLFYGDEEYLRETYVKRVADMVPDGGFPEFNHIKLEGADIPLSEYDDAWESFPMMTDKKLIHIKNSGIFKPPRRKRAEDAASPEEKKEFWTEKLKRISDDTVVIFDEAAVDKRGVLYKAASKAGQAVEFNYMSDADLVTWVVKQCLNRKVKMSKENAYYLITLCDPGLNNLRNELDKLFEYCDGEILRSDIERVVSKSVQVVAFELTDAVMSGDAAKAMSVLGGVKTTDYSSGAFGMLYLMLSNFENLLRVKLMGDAPQSEIIAALKKGAFIGGKYIELAARYSAASIRWMMRRVAEIDLAVKEGRVGEWDALEQYVMECTNKGRN